MFGVVVSVALAIFCVCAGIYRRMKANLIVCQWHWHWLSFFPRQFQFEIASRFFLLFFLSLLFPLSNRRFFYPHGYIHGMWSQLDLFSRWGFPIYNATTVNKRNIAAVALGNKWQVYQTTASLPCQWRQKNIGKRKRITKYCIIQAATGEVNAHRWNYSKVVIQFLYVAEKKLEFNVKLNETVVFASFSCNLFP